MSIPFAFFVQFLSRSFSNISAIKNYVSGIKLLHLLSGLLFTNFDGLEFKLLVKGLAKLNPFIPRQALPITPNILLDLHRVIDLSLPLHADLCCSFILAFFLFARKSNIVPPSHSKFNKSKHLCRRDIMIDKNSVVIYIK